MPAGQQVLTAVRINMVMQAVQDIRQLPAELVFLGRTPIVPAFDGEIMARFIGRVQVADLVADDQAAITYTSGKMTLETTNVPNIKHGQQLSQEQINQLAAIQAAGSLKADGGLYSQFESRLIEGLLLGIRQRMEVLIAAMKVDSLTYDRFGIKLAAVTWGMPSDLKVTAGTAWTNAGAATPVADVLLLKRLGQVRYGVVFRRLTMSLAAFIDAIATTEFQNKARMYLAPNVSFVNLPVQDTEFMRTLAANVFGMVIEIYDQRYWSQDETGVLTSAPYLPINKVLLEDPANDNNAMVADFASGVVTESIVSGMMATQMVGRLGGPTRGPVAYVTARGDLNPPNITYWGVARGFPRKHVLQSNAVLTVGNLTDPIPVTDPF